LGENYKKKYAVGICLPVIFGRLERWRLPLGQQRPTSQIGGDGGICGNGFAVGDGPGQTGCGEVGPRSGSDPGRGGV